MSLEQRGRKLLPTLKTGFPQFDKALRAVTDQIPDKAWSEDDLRLLIRSEVLRMKAEGVVT